MDNALLEIKNLHIVYDTDDARVYAVNGINLSMQEGETLGLVGETGAGKTTTALSILKLLPERVGRVLEGSIRLNDIDILATPEEEMRKIRGNYVSMIFQDPMTSLNPVLTVGEQIAEVLFLHNKCQKDNADEKVSEIMKMVGLLPERKDDYPYQFSGGMKQRIVIAIALACEPKLLLADEPTTALDVTIQAQVLKLMKDMKERLHTSMLLITHDLGVVAEICDTVAIMYAGEIIEYGKVEQVFEGENHHPYTVGLFGSIPDLTQKTRRLTPINGLMPEPTNLPNGCKFQERCPYCFEKCKTTIPGDFKKNGHLIRCHRFAAMEDNHE